MLYEAALKYLAIFIAAYLTTYFLTPIVMSTAIRFGAVDLPGERRIHQHPTPRGGGVAIFLGFHLSCALIFVGDYLYPWQVTRGPVDQTWWCFLLIASFLLLSIGIIDDIRGMGPISKLLGQFLVATFAFAVGIRIDGAFGLNFPFFFDYILTIFWFLFLINAFNFIDGYDGVSTGLAAIAALGISGTLLMRHLPLEALILTALIGSCVAFLRFNLHPARIFLGDSGSMFLGFTLAAITISTSSKGTGLAAIWVPILALGVPIFDMMLTVWRRTAKNLLLRIEGNPVVRSIMTPDTEHIHHRLMNGGITPRNVTATLYLANSLLVLVGIFSLLYKDLALGLYFVSFIVGAYILVRYVLSSELWDSGLIILHTLRAYKHPVLAGAIYLLLDCTGLALALVIVSLLSPELFLVTTDSIFPALPVWCSISLLCLLSLEPYRWIWSRTPSSPTVQRIIIVGAWLVFLVGLLALHREGNQAYESVGLLFCGLSLLFAVSIRLIPRIVEEGITAGNIFQPPALTPDECRSKFPS